MPNEITEHEVEHRGGAVGGGAPVEVIVDSENIAKTPGIGDELGEGLSPFSKAVLAAATPTISYSGFDGKILDQEFAPPKPGSANEQTFGMYWGQAPQYADATWFFSANPLFMFGTGLVVGLYEARRNARKSIAEASQKYWKAPEAKPQGQGNASVGTSQEAEEGNANVDLRSELEFYNARLEDVERLALSRALNEDARTYGGRARELSSTAYVAPSDSASTSPEKDNRDVLWG